MTKKIHCLPKHLFVEEYKLHTKKYMSTLIKKILTGEVAREAWSVNDAALSANAYEPWDVATYE